MTHAVVFRFRPEWVCRLANYLFRGRMLARYEAIDFAGALVEIWGWVSQLNQAIVQFQPWSVAIRGS